METATITQLIDADIDTVWAQITDVTALENWHPGVREVDLLSEAKTGVGATRRCNFYDGSDVREEVIESGPHAMRIRITGFKAPMKHFESAWSVRSTDSGATQLTVQMEYEMKFGVLGTVMNLLVVQGRMPRLIGKVLRGLDRHIATGEAIGQDFEAAA
jgi:ribosome-associated toxin RatA of RatAB toxin-antitoxin module